ncbi:DinB family protein [Ferruginibacter albus]|uniref:DinB family protein n=1 Tax=Ferruginibacter albus TaxID=2875540 RepID=UPI001CC4F443|nr:DinB family protein [Ferruginibacter albus]UAY51026.1 DinB family protein [Ferruginibacter albus]
MNNQQLSVKMILDAWNAQLKNANKLFDTLTDDQFTEEVAPDRNTGTYLLGHLVAVHDGLLSLLGFGQKLFPELEEPFIKTPNKSGQTFPPVKELKEKWQTVNAALDQHFNKLTPEEWFQKHTAVSEEDFAKEPHRNRLNVVISRTNHLANHLGQLIFLKK